MFPQDWAALGREGVLWNRAECDDSVPIPGYSFIFASRTKIGCAIDIARTVIMVEIFQKIVDSNSFHRWILGLILLSGALVGLETYPMFHPDTRVGHLLFVVQEIILWLFVAEIVIKIGACGSKPWEYFLNPWNVFDFVIIGICFLPFGAPYALVLRMARLLRAVRLLTILPKLQILVNALLRSIPSLGYVGIMLLLHFYIYAVMGTFLFSHNDPIRFGTLNNSMMTLFEVLTLEGWNDVFNTQALGSDMTYDEAWKDRTEGRRVSVAQPVAAAAYFVTFIMLGTMIMLNLFTGVIISSMQEAQAEHPAGDPDASLIHKIEQRGFVTLRDELELIGRNLREVAADVSAIKEQAGRLRGETLAIAQDADGAGAHVDALNRGESKG